METEELSFLIKVAEKEGDVLICFKCEELSSLLIN